MFVTTNATLARASREILENGSARVLPACVTDTFVGTVLWISSPEKASFTRRRQLLADCHSATRPDASLEARIVAEARKLHDARNIDDDDYVLLTTSFVTRDLLSEKTMNDVDALDGRTAIQILHEIKERIQDKADVDVRRITKQKEEEEQAKIEAELERDRTLTHLKSTLSQDARRKARIVNTICATGILLLEMVPLVIDILYTESSIPIVGGSISLVAIAISTYFAFRSFLESNYERLFTKYRDLLQKKISRRAVSCRLGFMAFGD